MGKAPIQDPFNQKKQHILQKLEQQIDASPKGSLDEPIVDLIELINDHPDMVTTSSCSGRLSIFLEGSKFKPSRETGDTSSAANASTLKVGGKGHGGTFVHIQHEAPGPGHEIPSLESVWQKMPDLTEIEVQHREHRYVQYKYESLILHVLCRNSQIAHKLYTIAYNAGYRESGVNNHNLVAIRISLGLDAPVGIVDAESGQVRALVDGGYWSVLGDLVCERFDENTRRKTILYAKMKEGLY